MLWFDHSLNMDVARGTHTLAKTGKGHIENVCRDERKILLKMNTALLLELSRKF